MDTAYLIVSQNHQRNELRFARNEAERNDVLATTQNYRISPIFPVALATATLPDLTSNFRITFFTPNSAFLAIGTVATAVESALQSKLWFSCGLASLIVISEDDSDWQTVRSVLDNSLRAYEVWSVSNNEVAVESLWLAPTHEIDRNDFTLDFDSEGIEETTALLLTDVQHAIDYVAAFSSQHVPELLPLYRNLVGEINDQISVIRESMPDVSAAASSSDCMEALKTSEEHQKRINVATDYLNFRRF